MPVMAPALVPAIMSTTMPLLLEGLEHAEVGHAAGSPAAESHADPHAAEVVDQPLQPVGQRPAPGQLGRRFGDLEIAAGEVGELRNDRDHGAAALQQPGDADLVAPAAGRHVDRLQAADCGVCRARRDEVDGAIDEFHQLDCPLRRQVRVDVENDAVGVLPLGGLLADFHRRQVSAVNPEWPEPHVRGPSPLVRIAENGELLTNVAQPLDEPFGRPARGG